jgi:uncharacterized membrane-anchored protein
LKPVTAKPAPDLGTSILLDAAQGLFPGYFALVMATGVVSIACSLLAMTLVARVLVAVNWVAYVALLALTLLRLWHFPRRLAADLSTHQRAPGFFTISARRASSPSWLGRASSARRMPSSPAPPMSPPPCGTWASPSGSA